MHAAMAHRLIIVLIVAHLCMDFAICANVDSYGGYTDLVFSFSPEIQDPLTVITNLKLVLNEASQFLHRITQRKFYFRDVTFLVPESWPSEDWWEQFEFEDETPVREEEAEVLVINDDGLYANRPYVLQHGGCGQQGENIYLPVNALSFSTDNKLDAQVKVSDLVPHFVHAWSRYRYGIFPEQGFPDDPLYPEFYSSVGEPNRTLVHHNSCSHPNIQTEGRQSDGDKACEVRTSAETGLPVNNGCKLEPVSGSHITVKSSFLSLPFLQSVTSFCDNQTHEEQKMNKQNVLCKGQSAWDIISGSLDFKQATSNLNIVPPKVNIKYAVDVDAHLELTVIYALGKEYGEKNRAKTLNSLLEQFVMNRIPSNGIIKTLCHPKHEGQLKLQHYEYELSDEEKRTELINQIVMETERNQKSNLKEALEYFLNEMEPTASKGGTLVLITSSGAGTLKVDQLRDKLLNNRMRLDLILYPFIEPGDASVLELENIAKATGGHVWTVREEENIQKKFFTQIQLEDALADTLRGHSWTSKMKTTISRKNLEIVSPNKDIIHQYYIQPGSAQSLTVTIYASHLIAPKDAHIRMGSNKYPLSFSPGQGQPVRVQATLVENIGTGQFNFKVANTPQSHIVVDISVTETTPDKDLKLHAWFGKSTEISENHVAIYAYLEFNGKPVRKASITAEILRPDQETIHLPLLDNGLGQPDITKDDGVYSRFFTDFSIKRGHYSVVVATQFNPLIRQEKIISSKYNKDGAMCCGSVFPVSGATPLTLSDKVVNLGSFFQEGKPPKDSLPPSRICDLRATNYDANRKTFDLVWTAPGSDYDYGTAHKYFIKSFHNYKMALTKFNNEGKDVRETDYEDEKPIAPENYGTEQRVTMKMRSPWLGNFIYYAMRAMDKNGNYGSVSNVVTVHIPSSSGSAQKRSLTLIQGLAIGFVVLVLISIVVITIVVLCRKKKNGDPQRETSRSFSVSDLNKDNTGNARSNVNRHESANVSAEENEMTARTNPIITPNEPLSSTPQFLARNINQLQNLPVSQQSPNYSSSQEESDEFDFIPVRPAPPLPDAHFNKTFGGTSSARYYDNDVYDSHDDNERYSPDMGSGNTNNMNNFTERKTNISPEKKISHFNTRGDTHPKKSLHDDPILSVQDLLQRYAENSRENSVYDSHLDLGSQHVKVKTHRWDSDSESDDLNYGPVTEV